MSIFNYSDQLQWQFLTVPYLLSIYYVTSTAVALMEIAMN